MASNRHFVSRKQIRWKSWDYSAEGGYFVTICTQDRLPYFGNILPEILETIEIKYDLDDVSSYLNLSPAGRIADACWRSIPEHYPFVELDAYVIMPNHIHAILFFNKQDKQDWTPNRFGPQKDSLGVVLGSFKAAVSRNVRQQGYAFVWQKKFYDRVLRNESEYQYRLAYIWKNPMNWWKDSMYRNDKNI